MRSFFRGIVLALNILAAIALTLSSVCSFVSPKTVWWLGFFGLVYGYLVAINVFFVVYWLFSSKKMYVLLSLITILSGWSLLGKHVQFFSKEIPEEKLSESIKVISFNVQGFLQATNKQPDGEMLNMFDFFRDEAPYIICMQEFVTDRRRNSDANSLRRHLANMPHSHIVLPGGYFGIATFSRHPIINRETIYARKTANACIFSDIVIGDDTVRVFNIHLTSVGFNNDEMHLLHNVGKLEYDRGDFNTALSILRNLKKSTLARVEQVEILLSHVAQSPYPVIICGDFNDPPASFTYRRVRGARNDAFVESGSGRSPTYKIGKIASLRIDYIMYSEHFKAYSYKSPRIFLSDHFPVISVLIMR